MSSEAPNSPYQDLESKLRSLKKNLLAKSETERKLDMAVKLEPGTSGLPLKRKRIYGETLIKAEKENRSGETLLRKSKELEQLAESTRAIFIELKNKLLIEKCLNLKLNERLEECVKVYNKEVCNCIVQTIVLKSENKAVRHKATQKISNLKKTTKTSQREFTLKTHSLNQNLEKTSSRLEAATESLAEAEKTISALRLEIESAKSNDIRTLNASLRENLVSNEKALDSERQKCEFAKKEAEKLKNELSAARKASQRKERNLLSLSKSLEESKDRMAHKMSERLQQEQARVDEIIKLHRDEAAEYEGLIRKRDEDIKELYTKISSQDEAIRKMGQSLLSLSRGSEESKTSKELDAAKLEILKLKSRLANLNEVKGSQPDSISAALQKGFRMEKEYNLLKEKNNALKKETLASKNTIAQQAQQIERAKKGLALLKEDNEQRTAFYRSVTHSILEKLRRSFEGLGEQAAVAGLAEMFDIVARCENSDLATPRLKRIVARFDGRSASAPRGSGAD